RGDRGPENVEDRKGELLLLGGFNEADVAQRVQRRRQQPGAHVDQRHRRVGRMQRVEDLHLIGHVVDVDQIGQPRIEALERAARYFGIERTGADLTRSEIVEQGPRDRGFADAAFSGANKDDSRLVHDLLPERNNTTVNHPSWDRTISWQNGSKDMKIASAWSLSRNIGIPRIFATRGVGRRASTWH